MMNELRNDIVVWKDRCIAILIIGMGCGLVLGTFLLVYSFIHIYSIGTIAGVQGRYFLPFYIFLPLIICNNWIVVNEKAKGYIRLGILALNILIVMCNFSTVIRGAVSL